MAKGMNIFYENSIKELPIEAIKKLSSTIGRSIYIQNWDKLIWHLNFLKSNDTKKFILSEYKQKYTRLKEVVLRYSY